MQRLRSFAILATLAALSCWLLQTPASVSSALALAATTSPGTADQAGDVAARPTDGPRTAVTVTLTRPATGDIVRPGEQFRIEWNVSDSKAVVEQRTLKFSTDSGATFTQDVKGVGGKKTAFFTWDVPPKLLSKTARLQLTIKFKDGTTAVSTNSGDFILSPQPQIANIFFTEASGKKPSRFDVNGGDFLKNDTVLLVNNSPVPSLQFLGKPGRRGVVSRLRVEGAPIDNILVPGIRVDILVKIGSTGVASDPLKFRRAAELVQSITPSTTRQGTVVNAVITGSKFTGASSVTFAVPGTTAEILPGANDTSLPVRITVAPDATIGILGFQIQVPLGIIDADPVRFTVLPSSAPSIVRMSPKTGPTTGGTPLFISGDGFVPGDMEVLIDGRPAVSLTVLDSKNLVALTPAGDLGSADVTVLTRSGYATADSGFRYTKGEAAVPAISGVSPDVLSSSGGQTVTITGSGFLPGATGVTFAGHAALDVKVLDAHRLIAVSPLAEAGAARISVETRDGVSSRDAAVSFGFTAPSSPTIAGINVAPFRLDDSSPLRALSSIDLSPFGGRLVLAGSGFMPAATQVTVGGVEAKIEAIRENLIVLSSPVGLRGSADVTVATPGGIVTLSRGVRFSGGDLPLTSVERILHPAINSDGSMEIAVLGTGFVAGQTFVAFDRPFRHPVDVVVVSSNYLKITVPAGETKPGRLILWTLAGQSGADIPEE